MRVVTVRLSYFGAERQSLPLTWDGNSSAAAAIATSSVAMDLIVRGGAVQWKTDWATHHTDDGHSLSF